jgi:hypothetical protein
MRLSFKKLNAVQLDMVIMGQLLAFTNTSTGTSTNKKVSHGICHPIFPSGEGDLPGFFPTPAWS